MQVVAEADWTGKLRGFWDLGLQELLLRREPEAEAAFKQRTPAKNAAVFTKRVRRAVVWPVVACSCVVLWGRGGGRLKVAGAAAVGVYEHCTCKQI